MGQSILTEALTIPLVVIAHEEDMFKYIWVYLEDSSIINLR